MRGFSFRSPMKAKRKQIQQSDATRAKAMPLFGRRASETPSLDELASPEPLLSESLGSETSGRYDDNAVDEDESEEDERERLRRAKARAFVRGATPVSSQQFAGREDIVDSESEYSPREFDQHEDDEEEEEEEGEREDELSTNVVELQRQVRGLLRSRVDADDAWRKENELLRERLALSESREAQLQQRVQQLLVQERLHAMTAATHQSAESSRPTPRERELLRLLVRIVGKEQIRVLLTPSSSSLSTQRTPAQLRRQLVTRAAAAHRRSNTTAVSSSASLTTTPSAAHPQGHGQSSPPRKPKSHVALTTVTTVTATPLLSGTRKHEMSDAM